MPPVQWSKSTIAVPRQQYVNLLSNVLVDPPPTNLSQQQQALRDWLNPLGFSVGFQPNGNLNSLTFTGSQFDYGGASYVAQVVLAYASAGSILFFVESQTGTIYFWVANTDGSVSSGSETSPDKTYATVSQVLASMTGKFSPPVNQAIQDAITALGL